MNHSEGSTNSYPVINYNPVGITTEMSFREGAPTVIGTLNTNRPDEMLVLVFISEANSMTLRPRQCQN